MNNEPRHEATDESDINESQWNEDRTTNKSQYDWTVLPNVCWLAERLEDT